MLSDVVVSASTDPEAFGRVLVEAQAMGRPVVATDHGAARETVIPGETGWLVAPGDASAMVEALHEACAALEATPRVALLIGSDGTFAAGADIKAMVGESFQSFSTIAAELQEALAALARLPQVVIAAITGYALGGGCELALTADFRFAAAGAGLVVGGVWVDRVRSSGLGQGGVGRVGDFRAAGRGDIGIIARAGA